MESPKDHHILQQMSPPPQSTHQVHRQLHFSRSATPVQEIYSQTPQAHSPITATSPATAALPPT